MITTKTTSRGKPSSENSCSNRIVDLHFIKKNVHKMSSSAFVITIVALSLATLSAASTPFTECTEGLAPMDVRVVGCTESPCSLYRGEDVSAQWDFLVTADTQKLTPRVRATFFGLTVPYALDQDNACDTLTNAECPLDKDEEVTYELTMPVLASYPKLSLTIEFAFVDDNSDVQVCFKIAAKVVDP